VLSLSSHYGARPAVTGPNKKAAVTVGTIFDLASLGLVGAVTIMLFGFASVPLLGSGKPVNGLRIGDSVFRYDDGNAALFLAQTYSPTLDLSTFLPAFPPRGLSRPHRFDRMGATPDFELPSPDHGASITPPQFTEISVSEQAAADRRLAADEVGTMPDALHRRVPTEMPDEGHDPVSSDIELQQQQPAILDQHNLALDARTPAPKLQSRRVNRRLMGSDPSFRNRVRKECGPIIFSALYRHCVASFGVHYR
jgi:hypothetical protein